MRTAFLTTFFALAATVAAQNWAEVVDNNLTEGCSDEQISCYMAQSRTICGQHDFNCLCASSQNAVSCLGNCQNGANAELAGRQSQVDCEARDFYNTAGGSPQGPNVPTEPTTTFTTTDDDGREPESTPTLVIVTDVITSFLPEEPTVVTEPPASETDDVFDSAAQVTVRSGLALAVVGCTVAWVL